MPVDAVDVILRLQNLRAFQAGMAEASTSVKEFGAANKEAAAGSREATAASGRWGVVTGLARKAVLGLGGAFLIAAGEGTKMAINFDKQMEMVHTQAGASQKEVNKLKGEVLDLAKVTPQGPEQLAMGLYHLESIGLRGSKAMHALKVAAEGAAVGNAHLEDTATALGAAWKVNIGGVHSMDQVMGVLNATVGAGNMRMQDLVAALGTAILPTAKTFGVTMQDVGGALAELTDEGQGAASAATHLRMAINLMGAPSRQAQKYLESIHITQKQMADTMNQPGGLIKTLQLLKNHLSGLDHAQRVDVLSKAFGGARSGATIMLLLNRLDQVRSKTKQIQDQSGHFGDAVAKTHQTAAFKIGVAWSNIQADLIKLGHMLEPIATAIVQFAAKAFNWLLKLPHGIKIAIAAIGGLALAFAAGGPWGAVIAAVIAGVILIVSHWKEIKKFLQPVVNWLVGAFHWITQQLGITGHTFDGIGKQIGKVINWIVSVAKAAFAVWKFLWNNVFSKVVKVIVPIVVGIVRSGLRMIGGVVKFISGLITGDWHRMWQGVKQIAKGALGFLLSAVKAVIAPFKATWDIIGGVVKTVWKTITSTIKDAWGGIMHFFGGLAGKVGNVFKDIWNGIVTFFKGALNSVIDLWDSLHFSIGGWTIHLPDPAPNITVPKITVGMPHIPHLAAGGMVLQSGTALVGEQGPELLHLPSGAVVEPLTSRDGRTGGSGGDLQPIHTHVYIDGKEVAIAVGKYTSRRLARR